MKTELILVGKTNDKLYINGIKDYTERMLKVSEIKMSVDKVLALAKTITTIQIKLPLNKEVYTQTMLMARHQKIAKLFDEEFWVTR
jgi:23S rRNA pseudoU1915 N3-methylase RlmH